MARSRRGEERLLSTDEHGLVSQTRLESLKEVADDALSDLVGRLREMRDKARDIAKRQRREMRGKAKPSGATAAKDDTGSRGKSEALTTAARRAGKELARRRGRTKRADQSDYAKRALEMKRAAAKPKHPDSEPEPNTGMQPLPNENIAPSGAFAAEGDKPVLERSHQSR